MGAVILITLLSLAPEAFAGPKRASATRATGASTMPDFVSCVQEAVLGRTQGECGLHPESEPCVGLRRALENSQKKTECHKMEQGVCRLWSHNGWSESRWISVAAGHLANFGTCVRKQYGSDTNPGLKEALADQGLLAFLKKLEDGGKVFQLTGSALLMGALKEERFSAMIENSPFAKNRTPHEMYLLKGAADTPSPDAALQSPAAAYAGGEGSNPASEGEDFEAFAKTLYASSEETTEPPVVESTPRKDPGRERKAAESFYALRFSKAPPPSARVPASRSPYSLGLDRNLFERVSSAYHRNSPALSGMEEYLKAYSPPPAKDYSDLLKRGGTL